MYLEKNIPALGFFSSKRLPYVFLTFGTYFLTAILSRLRDVLRWRKRCGPGPNRHLTTRRSRAVDSDEVSTYVIIKSDMSYYFNNHRYYSFTDTYFIAKKTIRMYVGK